MTVVHVKEYLNGLDGMSYRDFDATVVVRHEFSVVLDITGCEAFSPQARVELNNKISVSDKQVDKRLLRDWPRIHCDPRGYDVDALGMNHKRANLWAGIGGAARGGLRKGDDV